MATMIEKRRRSAQKAIGKGAGRAARRGAKGASGVARRGAQGVTGLKLIERSLLPERRSARAAMLAVVGGGVALVYVVSVRERRQRALKLLRRGRGEAARRTDQATDQVKGAAHEITPDRPKSDLTDRDLARKVESIIFREEDAPKGSVVVDAVGREVTLRGEVDTSERSAELADRARGIPEVERVVNLLHLPGEPAATRSDNAGS